MWQHSGGSSPPFGTNRLPLCSYRRAPSSAARSGSPVSYPASYRIEFFKNPSGVDGPFPPGTGFGEGEVFVASKNALVV